MDSGSLPDIENWTQWRALFGRHEVLVPAVRALCRDTGLAEGREIEAGFPGTCAVYVIDRSIVLKIFPPFIASDCLRETAVLRALARLHPELPVPRVIAQGECPRSGSWVYLAVSYCPGDAIRDVRERITPADRVEIASELGRIVRAVHAIPVESSGIADPPPDGSAWWQRRRSECLAKLREDAGLPSGVLAAAERFLDEHRFASRLCLANADYTEDHLLLVHDGERWKISALIDWADSEIAPPGLDWPPLFLSLFARDREMALAFCRSYDPEMRLDDRFRENALACTLAHGFGAEIIGEVRGKSGSPPVESLSQLAGLLWPRVTDPGS